MRIVACDLYDFHVNFCAREFGVEAVLSKENFDQLDFGVQFDAIFCGSLLSHLPDDLFRSARRLISSSLAKQGVAVISLHGGVSAWMRPGDVPDADLVNPF